MSFRLKTILGIALIELLLLSVLIVSGLGYLRGSNEQQLIDRAQTTAQLFATMTSDAVVATDLATLDVLVGQTVTNPGIVYVRVRHAGGAVLAEAGDPEALSDEFAPDASIEEASRDMRFDVRHAIDVAGTTFGQVEIGMDTAPLSVILAGATRWMLTVAALEIVLVGVFGYLLGRMLTRQLSSLQAGAKRVAEGQFGHEIDVKGRDELADTATSFNQMSAALKTFAADLDAARRRAEEGRVQAENVLQDAVESLSQGVLIIDRDENVLHLNSAYAQFYLGVGDVLATADTLTAVANITQPLVDAEDVPEDAERSADKALSEDAPAPSRLERLRGAGACDNWTSRLANGRQLLHSRRPLEGGGFVFVETDVTALYEAHERSRKLEIELLQSQKLEALGTLAGGIAHEINTPIQYIGDNLSFFKESVDDLFGVVDQQRKLIDQIAGAGASPEEIATCLEACEAADLDFLREELPDAVGQSSDGVKQVSNIVLAMKEFAHPTSKEKTAVDLNRVVERSLVVCRNEWKHAAEMDLVLADNLPKVFGHEGELNQIVLNLVVNAAHAIKAKDAGTGTITVGTRADGDSVYLDVADTGTGIPETVRQKIFEPFFTTKEVGKGTGQGLAICHDIAVNKHGGEIQVETTPGQGTTFSVRLPTASVQDGISGSAISDAAEALA